MQQCSLDELSSRIIGAALEVHSILGPGYLESIYEEALAKEFGLRNVSYERQKIIQLNYKGMSIGEHRLDFLVDKQIVLELKTVESLAAIHTAQVLSYLKMMNLELGLLINFNVPSLRTGIKRVVLTRKY